MRGGEEDGERREEACERRVVECVTARRKRDVALWRRVASEEALGWEESSCECVQARSASKRESWRLGIDSFGDISSQDEHE